MELLHSDLPDDCKIIALGDTHKGSVASDYEGFEEAVEQIATKKKVYGITTGDLIENISRLDKRFMDSSQHPYTTPLEQAKWAGKVLKRIPKGKLLAVLDGNHELTTHHNGLITRDVICEMSGHPYGGFSCKLSINRHKRRPFKIHAIHGRLRANSKNPDPAIRRHQNEMAVKKYLAPLHSDCVCQIVAHTHQLLSVAPCPDFYMYDNGEKLRARYTECSQDANYIPPNHRFYGNTGSFLHTMEIRHMTYSEIAGYPIIQNGYIEIIIRDSMVDHLKEIRID